jgi:hypothetical protein
MHQIKDRLGGLFYYLKLSEQFMKVTINEREYILLTKCPLLETTERYEFKTDVHKVMMEHLKKDCHLRDQARQSFNYSLIALRKEIPELFNILYSWMRKEFLIPQLLESATVGDLADDFIETETSNLGINIGTLILIYSNENYQVREVTEIGRYEVIEDIPTYIDGYRLNAAVTATGATIKPLRKCIISGDVKMQANGSVLKSNLNFWVLDSVEYPVANAPEQYKGDDLYFTPLLLEGNMLDVNFQQHQALVDGDLGGIWSFSHWILPETLKFSSDHEVTTRLY